MHEPRVLFLDEPTAGVDLELRRDLWRYVQTLRDRGVTIVLTTHYLDEAEELADRIGLIHQGRMLLIEDKTRLLAQFGERTLRITLSGNMNIPPSLRARGARLVDDGAAIEVTQPAGEELGVVLADVVAAGLPVRDIETRKSGLAEIYLRLMGRNQ